MIKSWLKLVFLALVWGSSFILMKRGLYTPEGEAVFSGVQVGALRIIFAGLALFPLSFKGFRSVRKSAILPLIVAGFIGNGAPALLFAIAQTHINSALAGILNALTPLFALLVGVAFFSQLFKWKQLIGVVLGLVGAIGLVLFQSSGAGESSSLWYAFLVLAACLCYGVSVNVIKHYLKEIPPLQITAMAFVIMLPAFVAVAYISGVHVTLAVDPNGIKSLPYIGVLGIVGTALAVFVFNKLIKETSAVFASSVTYLIPLVSIFWGLLDGELFTLIDALFCGVILMGVYIINKAK